MNSSDSVFVESSSSMYSKMQYGNLLPDNMPNKNNPDNNNKTTFLFSEPFKFFHHLDPTELSDLILCKLISSKEAFELAQPSPANATFNKIDILKLNNEVFKTLKQNHRTHVVVAEQAPFSVIKSVRAQEQTQKVQYLFFNKNLGLLHAIRLHPQVYALQKN